MNKIDLIVSRHPATEAFIRRETGTNAPVLASVSPDDVRGKVVAGNLPLSLASLCSRIVAVEFAGSPPRGQEYSLADMDAAGAKLSCYSVSAVDQPVREFVYVSGRKHRGHRDRLLVGTGDSIHEFQGNSIPGVCVVVSENYHQNGKWSGTTYTIRLSSDAWKYVSSQDWDSGERFDGLNWPEVISTLRKAGCLAPEEIIKSRLRDIFHTTTDRLDKTERELSELS